MLARADHLEVKRANGLAHLLALLCLIASGWGCKDHAEDGSAPDASARTVEQPVHEELDAGSPPMSFADGSFLDLVVEPNAVILVGRLEAISSRQSIDEQTEAGVIQVRAIRELSRSTQLGDAGVLRLQFMRYTQPMLRIREGEKGFNSVQLVEGETLLVGIKPASATVKTQWAQSILTPTAVTSLPSPEAPLVEGVVRSIAIEAEQDPQARLAMLQRGLTADQEFLVEYCHYAVGRMARIPRKDAVQLEVELLQGRGSKPAERLMAQATLELELWKDEAADDELNKKILEAFFGALLVDDSELRSQLVTALFGMLHGDSHGKAVTRYQEALLQGVALPSSTTLPKILLAMARDEEDVAEEAMWLSKFISRHSQGQRR